MRMTWSDHAHDVCRYAVLSPGMGAVAVIMPLCLWMFGMERSIESLAVSSYIWFVGIIAGYAVGTVPATVGALTYITWLWLRPAPSTMARGAVSGFLGFAVSLVAFLVIDGSELRVGGSSSFMVLICGLASTAAGLGTAILRDRRARGRDG